MGQHVKRVALLFIELSMKFIFLIFIFSSISLIAENNIRVNFKLYNSKTPNILFEFGFGINELAGDSVDAHLGEKSYPPFAPSFDAGLEYIDSTKFNQDGSKYYDLIRTNLDLRSIPSDKDIWRTRHKVVINWISAPTVVLEWNSSFISDKIDSIMIRDMLGGIVINQDMKKTDKLVLDNEAIDKLYFDVYYNLKQTSVEDEENKNEIIYPNPFSDIINIDESFDYDNFIIYDINGIKLIQDYNLNKLKNLHTGIYYILFQKNNKIIERKIISKYWYERKR